jgi:16S rRNA (adenine1518-N6/adenine1519-N6)-dimethyltransferase
MNLTSPSQVKSWCIANGFHPNKVLGQNFLIDRNALEAIVNAGELLDESNVLEIGPGLGVLTEELLKRGHSVTAIEKDPVLAERLAESLGNPEKLNVIAGDALDAVKEGACDGFNALVSNLPYQAGTRILLDVISRPESRAERIVILVQTEVAERLAAGPGNKTRGLAGVWVQFDYDVKIVRAVKASCFWPRPQIGSTVVFMKRHHRNDDVPPEVRATFKQLTKTAFEHRRKQLGSTFKGIIESTARAEDLTNEEWLDLATALTTTGEE